MSLKLAAGLLLALTATAAEQPLPELRVEPTDGGSIFNIRNGSSQPLTAYLIELLDYPGSSFSFWQDDAAGEPIAPGAEKRIQITNMTVGAVPEYVKMQAALYADGSSSGIPGKVKQLIERRRFTLETTRELIRRVEKSGAAKETVMANLKQWIDSMPPPSKANRNSQKSINEAAGKALVSDTATRLDTHSLEDMLGRLRMAERALALSKPPL